jgi:hypothetical protein
MKKRHFPLFSLEDGGSTFLRNVVKHLPYCTVSHLRKKVMFIVTVTGVSNPVTKLASGYEEERYVSARNAVPAGKFAVGWQRG